MMSRRLFAHTMMAGALGASAGVRAMTETAGPLEVLLIRHGEEADRNPNEHLNKAGRARAERLVALFPAAFATPDVLIAAKSSKASHRSVETLEPLAAALHLRIDDQYDDSQFRELATALLSKDRYAGKRVLVCWHHEQMAKLAKALGATNAPARWSPAAFDRVWQLRYTAEGVTFTDRPQSR